jgi:hypothetical protein
MQHDVGVGMTEQAFAMTDFDAAENQFAPAHEPVRIETVADTILGSHAKKPLEAAVECAFELTR